MLFSVPKLSRVLVRDLVTFDALCQELVVRTGGWSTPWAGRLRREWRASTAESSIEIEGYHVPESSRVGLVAGAVAPPADDTDALALACYGRAMDHVAALADDPHFAWLDRILLDLHFDACWFQPQERPGRYRAGGVGVTSPGGDATLAYVGPPAEEVPGLVRELTGWLEGVSARHHVIVRAAMTHLQLVSIHPFADGNGRLARIAQSLVLARDGVLAPEALSVEEYLGRHTSEYYAVLQRVQGGSFQPERDAAPWLRFCVEAHLDQAGRRLRQLEAAAARWTRLETLVAERGWPDRLVIALEQGLFEGVDRASYRREADVSGPTASNDLRRLVDAGFIERRGSGRSTRYAAAEQLRRTAADGSVIRVVKQP